MQSVGFVVFPKFQLMGLSMATVFEFANNEMSEPLYDIHILSEAGGPLRSSIGMPVLTEAFDATVCDTLLLCAGLKLEPTAPGLLAFLRGAATASRRIGATCTGSTILGEAGLLDNRRVTTHWLYASELQARFPKAKVEADRIFICDGPVWTSAGMSACVDLALAMVEKDLGIEMARMVARKLVVFHRRAGGQSQHSALLEIEPKSDRIQNVLAYAQRNLRTALSIEKLADAANLSPRQFSRAFHQETGQSPAKAIENLRVETARLMLEQGRHSLDVVALETGFADRDRMRRAFLRAYGQPPQSIRRNARVEALN